VETAHALLDTIPKALIPQAVGTLLANTPGILFSLTFTMDYAEFHVTPQPLLSGYAAHWIASTPHHTSRSPPTTALRHHLATLAEHTRQQPDTAQSTAAYLALNQHLSDHSGPPFDIHWLDKLPAPNGTISGLTFEPPHMLVLLSMSAAPTRRYHTWHTLLAARQAGRGITQHEDWFSPTTWPGADHDLSSALNVEIGWMLFGICHFFFFFHPSAVSAVVDLQHEQVPIFWG